MSHDKSILPLVAIMGPTATGKSALGVWLAERLGGEVVACDSTQLYKGFDVGTAKPVPPERRGIPHHLIDVLAPEQDATAGGYRQLAIAVLEDLRRRDRVPVFTVGTGLYLRVLLEGLADVPLRSEELRERLRTGIESHPPGHLHRILKRLDVQASRKIAATDEQKLIRAVEICLLAQRPLSEVHRSSDAYTRSAHPKNPRANRGHDRKRLARRSEVSLGSRAARNRETVRLHRLSRIAGRLARRHENRRRARRDSANHAPLREAPGDMVSQGGRRSLAGRIW